jgi:hypothetical protein
MIDNNLGCIDLNGSFDIRYVPDNSLKNREYFSLPLSVRITLGNETIGTNNSSYQSAGYEFSLRDYFQKIISIKNGGKETINFDCRYSVPLIFSTIKDKCLVSLEKEDINNEYVSFNKENVGCQIVSLDDTIFKLTNVVNDFFHNIEKRKVYSLIDDLLIDVDPFLTSNDITDMYKNSSYSLYSFDKSKSLDRVFYSLCNKKKVYHNYEDFLDSLNIRQLFEWNNVLNVSKLCSNEKEDEKIYHKINLESHAARA